MSGASVASSTWTVETPGAVSTSVALPSGKAITASSVTTRSTRRVDVDGQQYLIETALRADFALVHAFLADYLGNLSYALTARNFNPVIAMAGETVITDADHIVPIGVISPDHVVTPAPIVDYLIAN